MDPNELRTLELDIDRHIFKVNGAEIPRCSGFTLEVDIPKQGNPMFVLTLKRPIYPRSLLSSRSRKKINKGGDLSDQEDRS